MVTVLNKPGGRNHNMNLGLRLRIQSRYQVAQRAVRLDSECRLWATGRESVNGIERKIRTHINIKDEVWQLDCSQEMKLT